MGESSSQSTTARTELTWQRDELGRNSFPWGLHKVPARFWHGLVHVLNDFARSYDYGSAIRETRALTDKFDEVKREAMFIRSSPQFLKTDWMGNSSLGIPGVTVDGSGAFVTSLMNRDSGTWFHVARQESSTSTYVSIIPLEPRD